MATVLGWIILVLVSPLLIMVVFGMVAVPCIILCMMWAEIFRLIRVGLGFEAPRIPGRHDGDL